MPHSAGLSDKHRSLEIECVALVVSSLSLKVTICQEFDGRDLIKAIKLILGVEVLNSGIMCHLNTSFAEIFFCYLLVRAQQMKLL